MNPFAKFIDQWTLPIVGLLILGAFAAGSSKPQWNPNTCLDRRVVPVDGIPTVIVSLDEDHWFEVMRLTSPPPDARAEAPLNLKP